MLASLFLHPDMVLPLWRRALIGARQPARLDFHLDSVEREGRRVLVRRTEQMIAPLACLTTFELAPDGRGGDAEAAPFDLLLAPPMAGGYPFILRDVAAWFLGRARVHVIEWLNVRETPGAGRFTVDEQISVVIDALGRIGGRTHLAAFCQAGYAALTAAAVAAKEDPDRAPLSLSLVAAPLDPRAAPSVMGEKIAARGIDVFRSRRGGRRDPETGLERGVYPAEIQLGLVMNTIAGQNPETHEFSRMMLRDEGENPDAVSFLEMATSIMDLPWEHFRDNIERVYLEDRPLAERLRHRDRAAPLEALADTPILVVEGGKDALVAPGQCAAVFDALPTPDPDAEGAPRRSLLIEDAGHFGLFYGDKWRAQTAPAMLDLIQSAEIAKRNGGRKGGRVRRASA